MRVAMRLPSGGLNSAGVRAMAQAAERLGYDSVWCAAHVAIPVTVTSHYPLNALGRPTFNHESPFADPFVTLAFAAAVTERIRLGTVVVPMITTHPLQMAKQAATLDLVSDGRFELGIGAGWLFDEADALGFPRDHPNGRMEEAIQLMRTAWRDGTFEHRGRYWDLPPLGVYPQPPQRDRIPIWIGGKGRTAERIVDTHGAGLILSRQTIEETVDRKQRYPRVPLAVVEELHGSADEQLQLAQRFRDAGADLYVAFSRGSVEAQLEAFASFAENALHRLG